MWRTRPRWTGRACVRLQAVCYQTRVTQPEFYLASPTSQIYDMLIRVSVTSQTTSSASTYTVVFALHWMTARHSVQAGMDVAADTVDGCCVSAVTDATLTLLKCLSLPRRSPVTLTAVTPRSVSIFRRKKERKKKQKFGSDMTPGE